MPDSLNITVLLGGPSAEREVSLQTGKAAAAALASLGHAVRTLDITDENWSLSPDTDLVFIALHGTYGEDGGAQQRLEDLGVPYTGSGPEASRLAFDKALTKTCLQKAGVATAPFVVLRSAHAPVPPGWRTPFVVKPVRQGSSVGLGFVERMADWRKALVAAFQHDTEVLLEPKLEGRETTVAILDGAALPIVEIRPHMGSYDYTNKYTPGKTEYFCPAPFESDVARRICDTAFAAFQCVGARDYGRVDIIVKANGEPVVLEVNTIPGMTTTSLLPKAAAAAGIGYAALCQRIVDLGMERAGQLRR